MQALASGATCDRVGGSPVHGTIAILHVPKGSRQEPSLPCGLTW